MSYDLQLIRDRLPPSAIVMREHAIYLDAQRTDRKVQKARNVADLLERGHRGKPAKVASQLVDLKA
jgi:hypothetical protein